MRRVLVGDLGPAASLTLDQASSHHLLRVLRLGTGAAVTAFDGAGFEAAAVVDRVDGDLVVLRLVSPAVAQTEPLPVHLFLGLPKGPAMEQAVRMAVELGVTDLHPVSLTRSVVRGDQSARWARIAAAASRQCGRAFLPRVHATGSLAAALQEAGLHGDVRRLVAVPGAPRLMPVQLPTVGVAVVVGPEGGLTPAEVLTLEAAGFCAVGLSDHVLRVDTAVAALIALVTTASPQGKSREARDRASQ